MKAWEYLTVSLFNFNVSNIQETLNEHGKIGWELVSVTDVYDGKYGSVYTMAYFKRELFNQKENEQE